MSYFSKDLLLTGILGYLIVAAKSLPSGIFNFLIRRFSVSIYAASSDYNAYDVILSWLESLNNQYLNNNIRLDFIYTLDDNLEECLKSKFNLNYGNYLIKLDLFTFAIVNKSTIDNHQQTAAGDQVNSINISIFGKNRYKYKEYLTNKKSCKNNNAFLCVYGDKYISQRLFRSFDTVIMNDTIKKRIINYIDIWINNKQVYLKNNIPYKAGILLYGQPGTGKSSLAKAIASYLKYDINLITIDTISNGNLNPNIRNTVFLIEDIDCMFTSREYSKSNTDKNEKQLDKALLGDILNFIDGQASPENCIFIATTNHIERLDPALIRPGRFDLQIEMKYLDYELACKMCKRFNKDPDVILKDETLPISPAYLQSKLIENLYNE